MIKRLKIKDYMAHQDTELELSSGVTVLTGPNNSGKSAVVEAVRSVAQNPVPHHVIRHGAGRAKVRVELDSGDAIEWIRSRGNTVYRLFRAARPDGVAHDPPEVYAKFGRTPPEDIRHLLRLDLVETENGTVDIHIGNQRYPIFLLDQTGSQAASFFAASTEAEYLLRIQQALKTRTDRAKARRKELLQESTALEAALGLYLPLDDLELELVFTEALHASLRALQQDLPHLGRTLEMLHETSLLNARKVAFLAILEELTEPPQTLETQGIELTLHDLEGNLSQIGLVVADIAVLEVLSEPPSLPDTTQLDALLRALDSNRLTFEDRCRAGGILDLLEPPPALHATVRLDETTRGLERVASSRNRATAVAKLLSSIQTPPETELLAPLLTLLEQSTAGVRACALHAARGSILEDLREPPQPHSLRPLEELTMALHQMDQRIVETQRLTAALALLRPAPEELPLAAGKELLERLHHLTRQLDDHTRLQNELASAVATKRREIENVIQELGLCPVCGKPLEAEHFLEEDHA